MNNIEFSTADLKRYYGTNGQPAYVVIKGMVYDVTDTDFWKNGSKNQSISAGDDVTDLVQKAPDKNNVTNSLRIVGKVIDDDKQ